MLCIGLTGTIASGKSTVAKIFNKLGAAVISADKISKELTDDNSEVLNAIAKKFGKQILDKSGKLKRPQLREKIFNDKAAQKWLEDLLHPLIRDKIKEAVSDRKDILTIVEIPLLKDRKPYPYLDHVLLVTADPNTQTQRIMQRDNCNEKQAKKILDAQPSSETYQSVADTVLHNDACFEELEKQVIEVYKSLTP